MCERVLNLDNLNAVIINDLAEDDALYNRSYIKDGPKWRFYAGVPLKSPDGAVIGALCILDDKVRQGLPTEDVEILHDLADTIVEHLATYKLREDNRRGERMVRGLTSFLEGASELQLQRSSGDEESDQEAISTAASTIGSLQKVCSLFSTPGGRGLYNAAVRMLSLVTWDHGTLDFMNERLQTRKPTKIFRH